MPSGEKRVFLSFSQENAELADALARVMSQRGASVFFDKDAIRLGDRWLETRRAKIEKASALVLLIPAHDGPNRNTVLFEAGAAKALGKRVLAVLPPHWPVLRDEVPVDIADVVVLDMDERPLESIADMLVQAVPESTSLGSAPADRSN